MFNANYDYWMSCLFLLECYTNSIVIPTFYMQPYKVNFNEYNDIDGHIFWADFARACIVLYVVTVNLYIQAKFEQKHRGVGLSSGACTYLFFTPVGIADQ